ncbi:hypothetical protein BD413DRAFT_315297 [Trametes elegans]|nr:hypothetical protein BD413DRAFT_315297 [Trametes elegans]
MYSRRLPNGGCCITEYVWYTGMCLPIYLKVHLPMPLIRQVRSHYALLEPPTSARPNVRTISPCLDTHRPRHPQHLQLVTVNTAGCPLCRDRMRPAIVRLAASGTARTRPARARVPPRCFSRPLTELSTLTANSQAQAPHICSRRRARAVAAHGRHRSQARPTRTKTAFLVCPSRLFVSTYHPGPRGLQVAGLPSAPFSTRESRKSRALATGAGAASRIRWISCAQAKRIHSLAVRCSDSVPWLPTIPTPQQHVFSLRQQRSDACHYGTSYEHTLSSA